MKPKKALCSQYNWFYYNPQPEESFFKDKFGLQDIRYQIIVIFAAV